MFTGIIEQIGELKRKEQECGNVHFTIESITILMRSNKVVHQHLGYDFLLIQ